MADTEVMPAVALVSRFMERVGRGDIGTLGGSDVLTVYACQHDAMIAFGANDAPTIFGLMARCATAAVRIVQELNGLPPAPALDLCRRSMPRQGRQIADYLVELHLRYCDLAHAFAFTPPADRVQPAAKVGGVALAGLGCAHSLNGIYEHYWRPAGTTPPPPTGHDRITAGDGVVIDKSP